MQALRARWTRPCEKADPSQQRLRATSAVQPLIGIVKVLSRVYLGTFPLWRTSEPLLGPLEPVYEAASVAGIELFEAEESRPDVEE